MYRFFRTVGRNRIFEKRSHSRTHLNNAKVEALAPLCTAQRVHKGARNDRVAGGIAPPSSHTTVRTGPYTAVQND
jgi:hypothetical protein